MKKKQRSILGIVFCMLLLFVSVLSGCGKKKVTAESLIKEVQANTENAESVSANMKLEMGMSIKSSGMSMDLDVTGDFDMEATNEPVASHLEGTLAMSLMGLSVDMESYTVTEDGKAVTYTKTMDEWAKTEVDLPEENQVESIESLFDDSVAYTLSDSLEKADGKDVYVLSAEISGDMMNSLMGSMSESMDEMSGDLDWSKFSADITLKVDKATKMPVEVFMDCSEGMSELMESAGASGDEEIQIKSYTLTISFTGFNDVEEIVVPDEAKSAVEEDASNNGLEGFLGGAESELEDETSSENDNLNLSGEEGLAANADGTYTLNCFWGEGSVNIGVPQGYEISPYSDDTYLSFSDTANADFDDVDLTYRLSTDYTEDELLAGYADNAAYYEEDEDYSDLNVQDVKKVQTSAGEVGYVKMSYTYDENSYYVEYYAYMFIGDNLVLECEIEENAYETACALVDEATIMETVFSVVQPQ